MSTPPFRLSRTQLFAGLNIHCGFPAIAGHIEYIAGSAALTVDAITALQPYLLNVAPELSTEAYLPPLATLELPHDPFSALGLTLAWLTAGLQNLANACVSDIAIDGTANENVVALSGYQLPEVAAQAMQLACAIVTAGLQSPAPGASAGNSKSALKKNLANFLSIARTWHFDVATHTMVSAAGNRNIPHYRICPSARFVQLGQGVHQRHVFETISDRTSEAGAKIAHNKIATHHLLRALGIPTAWQIPVATFEQAVQATGALGFPVVIKPSHGMQSRGVTVAVRNQQELKAAYQVAVEAGLGGILVETFVPGYQHRLFVIDGRLATVVKWIPAQVVGDGTHSVEQLISIANQDPKRGGSYGHNFDFGKTLAKMTPNAEMDRWLATKGYSYSSIPANKEVVRLHGTFTMASGGDGIDVSAHVHPDVRAMAELIARAFKLDAVGIDYLSDDVSRSYRSGGGAVCEVNACPGVQGHWAIGIDRRKIIGALLDSYFPEGKTGRVPTIAIAQSPGSAAVACMVAGMLEASGKTTALAFSGGVYIGACKVRDEDSAGGGRARAVMQDPRVEAAVLELGCSGLLESGMPVDACDVAAVLGVESGSPGQVGMDSSKALAALKLLVPRTASRLVVLNADDAHCVSMDKHLRHVPICWVSLNPDNPVIIAHAGAKGITTTLSGTGENAEITIAAGPQRKCIARIGDLPADCRDAEHATVALFAAGIACALDIPIKDIRSGLESFQRAGRSSAAPSAE